MEFDVDTHTVFVLVDYGTDEVDALDYDYRHGYVYFPRFYSGDIMRYVYF